MMVRQRPNGPPVHISVTRLDLRPRRDPSARGRCRSFRDQVIGRAARRQNEIVLAREGSVA